MNATKVIAKCTMRGRRIRVRRIFGSGWYAVGCGDVLVGNYPTPQQAVAAAREHVRMVSGCTRDLPRVSQAFVDAVADLAGQ